MGVCCSARDKAITVGVPDDLSEQRIDDQIKPVAGALLVKAGLISVKDHPIPPMVQK